MPNRQEPFDNRHSLNPATRHNDDSATTATSESDFRQTVNPLQTSTSIRGSRAPTVISTASEQVPPSANTESLAPAHASARVVTTSEPAQTPRQTRAVTKSLNEAIRTEAEDDTIPNSNNQTTFSPDVLPNALKGRRKLAQAAQPVAATESAAVEANGATRDEALEQVEAGGSKAKVPRKRKAGFKVRASSTVNNEVLDQSQTAENPLAPPADSAASKRRSARKRKQRLSAQEVADEIIDEATAGADRCQAEARARKRKRKQGPEEAESHEIVPSEVIMADLVKDQGLGKTSVRYYRHLETLRLVS